MNPIPGCRLSLALALCFSPILVPSSAIRWEAMGLGRRKIRVDDASAWIFNRIAHHYEARPAYPQALVDAVADLVSADGGLIGDLGAGIGHLALPLTARGLDVVAIEPAEVMLDRLRAAAHAGGLKLRTVHAAAEALPLETGCLDVVAVVDALHFLDRELAANEIARVLSPDGALALVTCALGDTPFMRGVVAAMEDAAPRRPRPVAASVAQLAAVVKVALGPERHFHDEVPVDGATLDRIVRSISFIGPAMNPERFAAFRQRIHALPYPPVWARTFTLRSGRRQLPSRVRRIQRSRRSEPAAPR
jgi:SAM-dependent methyltransferase